MPAWVRRSAADSGGGGGSRPETSRVVMGTLRSVPLRTPVIHRGRRTGRDIPARRRATRPRARRRRAIRVFGAPQTPASQARTDACLVDVPRRASSTVDAGRIGRIGGRGRPVGVGEGVVGGVLAVEALEVLLDQDRQAAAVAGVLVAAERHLVGGGGPPAGGGGGEGHPQVVVGQVDGDGGGVGREGQAVGQHRGGADVGGGGHQAGRGQAVDVGRAEPEADRVGLQSQLHPRASCGHGTPAGADNVPPGGRVSAARARAVGRGGRSGVQGR